MFTFNLLPKYDLNELKATARTACETKTRQSTNSFVKSLPSTFVLVKDFQVMIPSERKGNHRRDRCKISRLLQTLVSTKIMSNSRLV